MGPPWAESGDKYQEGQVIYGRLRNGTTTAILTAEDIRHSKILDLPPKRNEPPWEPHLDKTGNISEESFYGFKAAALSPDKKYLLFTALAWIPWLGLYDLTTSEIKYLPVEGLDVILWDPTGKRFYGIVEGEFSGEISVSVFEFSKGIARRARDFWISGGRISKKDLKAHHALVEALKRWKENPLLWLNPKDGFRVQPGTSDKVLKLEATVSTNIHRWVFNLETGEIRLETSP